MKTPTHTHTPHTHLLVNTLVYNLPPNGAPCEIQFFKMEGQTLFDASKSDSVFTLCVKADLIHLPHIKVFHNSILLSLSLAKEKK